MAVETQIVREAPEIEAYKLGLLEQSKKLYGQPLNLPAVEAAGISGTSRQAFDLAKQGIGAYQPYIDAGSAGITQGQNLAQSGANVASNVNVAPEFTMAQGTLGRAAGMAEGAITAGIPGQLEAMDTVGQGIGGYGAATGGYDTAQTAAFMNPYQEMVTQNAMKEMRRQGEIAAQGTAAQAVRSGAFGGTREGVQRAEQERNLQDLMSQRAFQDYAANYGQAQTAGMTAFEAERQRQLAAAQGLTQAGGMQSNIGKSVADIYSNAANTTAGIGQGIGSLATNEANVDLAKANALGSMGSSIGAMGVQQAALGEGVQRMSAADVGLLSGIGSIEQTNAQAQLDAERATKLQETMAPYQQLAFTSDIYKGAPSSQMTLTSSSAPTASPFQSAAGAVIGGVTTAAAANKAGLF
jgi:hypothetical protein